MTDDHSQTSRLIIAYADLLAAQKAVADERTRIALLMGKMTAADIKTAKAKAKATAVRR